LKFYKSELNSFLEAVESVPKVFLLLFCFYYLQLSRKTKFLDRIRVYVRGGAGGQGYVRYGGLGGDGGNVVMVAKSNKTLLKLAEDFPEKRFIAKNGADSK